MKSTEKQALVIPWAGKNYRILLSFAGAVLATWFWVRADGEKITTGLAVLLTAFALIWMFSVSIEIHPAAQEVKRVTWFLDSLRLHEKCFPLDAYTAIKVRFSYLVDSEGNSADCRIDLQKVDGRLLPVAFYQKTMWKDQAAIDWAAAEATIAGLIEATKLPVVHETEAR